MFGCGRFLVVGLEVECPCSVAGPGGLCDVGGLPCSFLFRDGLMSWSQMPVVRMNCSWRVLMVSVGSLDFVSSFFVVVTTL